MNPTNQTAEPPTPGNGRPRPGRPRAVAFCSPEGPEVFHAVAHRNEVWRPDPFDVETIHEEARDVFRKLVARAGTTPRPDLRPHPAADGRVGLAARPT